MMDIRLSGLFRIISTTTSSPGSMIFFALHSLDLSVSFRRLHPVPLSFFSLIISLILSSRLSFSPVYGFGRYHQLPAVFRGETGLDVYTEGDLQAALKKMEKTNSLMLLE